jgi:hypothetical protein
LITYSNEVSIKTRIPWSKVMLRLEQASSVVGNGVVVDGVVVVVVKGLKQASWI